MLAVVEQDLDAEGLVELVPGADWQVGEPGGQLRHGIEQAGVHCGGVVGGERGELGMIPPNCGQADTEANGRLPGGSHDAPTNV